jgi:hypothetical protein
MTFIEISAVVESYVIFLQTLIVVTYVIHFTKMKFIPALNYDIKYINHRNKISSFNLIKMVLVLFNKP